MPIEISHSSHDTIDLTRLRWRFVICSASFYVNAITWGFISSTGIFEDAFKNTYQLSSFKSTLPGSIQIATMSVFSVFASVLTIKYGVRWTTVSGAFISAIGSILAATVGDYWAYCSFYGVLIGAGEAFMLVPAVLAIPPYFHFNRVSLATASAVSGASIGMFGIPLLLQYLLDSYGLRGATLLGSCLWLSVALAGSLFGQGVISIEEENTEIFSDESFMTKTENEKEHPTIMQHQSNASNSGLVYSRRTSLLPTSVHYHKQQKRLSSSYQQHRNSDKLMDNMPNILEGITSNLRDKSRSSVDSSTIIMKSHTLQSINTNAHSLIPHNDHNRLSFVAIAHAVRMTDNTIYKQIDISQQQQQQFQIQSNLSKDNEYFHYKIISEICCLLRINIFRILIISIILVWSLDETNFLFLTDLLKSSGQSEQRSTLLISIIGVADLIGQLFFGYALKISYNIIVLFVERYLGDIECIDSFILWTCTSIIAGLTLSIAPFVGSYGIISLCLLFAVHAFFLAAPNALGNIIMIEVVGMHRYPLAYGFSLLVSGSTSLFGYPLLGLLKDKTQSWTIPFALVGSIMIFGGLVAGTIPLYTYYKMKKRKPKKISMTGN
ncbi:unnamed protein product [Rotaria sp. Silwood2]|nr:unnamed protein product [Rotaria sp. Silwood2]CAF2668907.1 unnamed protein product [Rotaria sp. Silwood2]CAF3103661.1 unnamed protein product [Rotaria sp. Silwood2]CAF3983734.1 unnamed protein product [Rotaria sp. Silwood2]CAF4419994.1 unnamed protein product [Rotaria sp. Silwood2]